MQVDRWMKELRWADVRYKRSLLRKKFWFHFCSFYYRRPGGSTKPFIVMTGGWIHLKTIIDIEYYESIRNYFTLSLLQSS